MVNSPVVFCEIIFLAVSLFNDKLVEVVIVACFPFNVICNPFVLSILKLPSVIVFCLVKIFVVFKSILSCNVFNEDSKFKVLEIVKLPSVIIFCLFDMFCVFV